MTRHMTLRDWQQHNKKYFHIRKAWLKVIFFFSAGAFITWIGAQSSVASYGGGIITGIIIVACIVGMATAFDED